MENFKRAPPPQKN